LSTQEIKTNESKDPLLETARQLIQNNILNEHQIKEIYKNIQGRIDRVALEVISHSPIKSADDVMSSIVPKIIKRKAPVPQTAEVRQDTFGIEWKQMSSRQTMAKLINWGLTDILLQYKEAIIFGEDVAKK